MKWPALLLAFALGVFLTWSRTNRYYVERGEPGDSVTIDLGYEIILIEIDPSHATRHDAAFHGAPGFVSFRLHVFWPFVLSYLGAWVLWWPDCRRILRRLFPRALSGQCPRCRTPFGPSDDHCRHCGRPRRRCVKCRYDLTGNESGICPECGTRIEGSVET